MARKVILNIFLILLMIIAFPINTNAEAVSKTAVKDLIVKHSIEMGMDPALALSIAKKESNFNHGTSSKYGAVGVFQLMPNTAKKLGYNPYHINDNIKCGITYYKMMYKMFGKMDLALAAYNAGPGNVKKYNGIPPFAETKRFVSVIMSNYNDLKANPDPAIHRYNQSIAAVNVQKKIDIKDETEEKIIEKEINFRLDNDAIIKSYLSNQGI